jgi:uncharacterized lipoprotein YddW (UPF0748 family)
MPGGRVLDVLVFASPEAAAQAWRAEGKTDDAGARLAKESTAPVEPLLLGGKPVLRFRCNYAGTTMPRAVWDHAINLDLTRATAVVFDVYGEGLAAVGSINLFIRSGEGWYGATWYPKQEGAWCRVRIPKGDFTVDKSGAGWSQVTGLRLSPWAAKREDAVLCLANLGIEETDGSVRVVTPEAGIGFAATVHALFEEAGLPLPGVVAQDLTPALLAGTRLVVLPNGEKISVEATRALADFVRGGGRLIAAFSLPGELTELLGVKLGGYRPQAYSGEFSSMRFAGPPPEGVPATIGQSSWAVAGGQPVAGVGTVAAWWHDAQGKRTDAPAIITSRNGAWISHVVLKDDPRAKAALLLGLAAQMVPDLRRQACTRRLALLGMEVSTAGWAEAVRRTEALPDFARGAAPASLTEAQASAGKAHQALAAGDWLALSAAADIADERLRRAYCLAQRPIEPEFRGTWCHPREGIQGWGWERTAVALAAAGIDHLFLNVLHGASTSYPSKFAPFDRGDTDGRDYLSEAVAACARHGVKVHVWITNYQLHGHAPEELVAKLGAEGRLQCDREGKIQPALCPVNEANVKLQRDLMLEAATWPGVAGVHFDYIRYPDDKTCFCAACRSQFEKRIGKPAAAWPGDVLADGPRRQEWLQFRRDAITRLVREVHAAVRQAAPACQISAAVFSNYPACRDSVGQDWELWVRSGWLDFVCPMDYTASDAQFRNQAATQLGIVGGRVPCYPGIGLLEGLGPVGAVRQIQITRDLGTGGFIVWSVFPEYIDAVYPYLGLGMLKGR